MSEPTSSPASVKRLGRPPRPLRERFWEKVDRRGRDECWLWKAGCFDRGYGVFKMNGRTRSAHIVALELTNGPIPPGLCVCHSCDVRYPVDSIEYRKCCNPDHLWLGTKADNNYDRHAKGRDATGARSASGKYPEKRQGANNGNAKITPAQVLEIRALCEAGGLTLRQIASRYGLYRGTVYLIARRRAWKSVA